MIGGTRLFIVIFFLLTTISFAEVQLRHFANRDGSSASLCGSLLPKGTEYRVHDATPCARSRSYEERSCLLWVLRPFGILGPGQRGVATADHILYRI